MTGPLVHAIAPAPHGARSGSRQRHTIPRHVAVMLRDARRSRGWSLRTAGRRAGVSPSTLVHLEAARRAPSETVAAAIIRAYELLPSEAAALWDVAVAGAGRDWRSWCTPVGSQGMVHDA